MLVRPALAILGSAALSAAVLAQTRPEFEVASVRPSTEQINQVSVGVTVSGSQVRIASMSLRDYIGVAYAVPAQRISGPDWLSQARFDVAARIPEGAAPGQVPEMLQALLADRFQMKMHREPREFPVFALTVARGGLKIQEAAGPEPPASPAVTVAASGNGAGVNVDLGNGASFSFAGSRMEARRITMTEVADMLGRFLDRAVVDATGLTGRYDLSIAIAPEDYTAMMVRAAVNGGVSLPPQALRVLDGASSDPLSGPLAAAGLTLESRRAALDVLVIDSVLRMPTEN